jgi:dTDP-4-dehydrorhamnose reductase
MVSMNADIIITGASGYVGSRLYYDLSRGFKTLGTYKSKPLSEEFERLDITNYSKVEELIRTYKPMMIIHAAANASSKSCESDPMSAIETNQKGTENIVNAANQVGATVTYISTTVAELQKSLYEKTKFNAEEITRGAKAGYIILKPSVIFGMSPNTETDKPFNQMLRNIEGSGSLDYDTSWRFQPTWIAHMSEIIASIMENNIHNKEIPVLVPEMKSKFDIANDILSRFGVSARPKDEKSWRPSTEHSTAELKKLGLPIRTYDEMREGIVNEIKERAKYSI